MWLQAGTAILKGVAGYIQSSREAKYKKALQEYNNKMLHLANAQNQNAIILNQNMAVERSLAAQFEISRSEYTTLGQATVSAAASGTAGRSVNQTMYQIQRSADEADSRRMSDLEAQMAGFQQQRLNSAMQASQQVDISFIPRPSPVSAMLGIGGDLSRIWQQHNPQSI